MIFEKIKIAKRPEKKDEVADAFQSVTFVNLVIMTPNKNAHKAT